MFPNLIISICDINVCMHSSVIVMITVFSFHYLAIVTYSILYIFKNFPTSLIITIYCH